MSQNPALLRRLRVLNGAQALSLMNDTRTLALQLPKEPQFRKALIRHKALADEKRILIVALLKRRGTLCGCEFQAALGISHATVSHHMDQLVHAALVNAERRGKWMYYSLAPGEDARAP